MKNCFLCDIVTKTNNQFSNIVYENQKYIALLDSSPISYGHIIVFAKKHYSSVEEMGKNLTPLFLQTITWAEEVKQILSAKAYTIKLNNLLFKLEDDPRHVGHIHFHIVPRYDKNDLVKKTTTNSEYFTNLVALLGKTTSS